MDKQTKINATIAVLISCIATWPLVIDPTINISRHFDIFGTLWLSEGVQNITNSQFTYTNFPIGAPIGHIDSWLWFVICLMNKGLLSVERLLALVLTISLALNIWSTKWCARVWGVSEISSWSVALLVGLSGNMLNALLEGSWYLTSQFWLPLLAGSLLKYQQTRQQQWYFLLNISWIGSLLTSAYLGLIACLVLLFLTLYIQPYRRRKEWFIKILGPICVMGVLFTLFFLSVYQRRGNDNLGVVGEWATMGSSNLWNYLFWNPDLDIHSHSLGPVGNIFILIGLILAPYLKPQSWKVWWLLGMIGFLLSFGFQIGIQDEEIGIPWILQAFIRHGWVSFIHFPVRFHWMTDLSGAILFGLIATQFIPRKRFQSILLGLVCIHIFWIQGWQERKGTRQLLTEPLYTQLEDDGDALFELYPVFSSYSDIDPLDVKNRLCFQQTVHHRPLLISCMGTRTDDSVDWIVRTAFLHDALTKGEHDWGQLLPEIGVDTIVFHYDWFAIEDAKKIETVLNSWFGEAAIQSESGHIQIWSLSGPIAPSSTAKSNLQQHFPGLF